jgi:predicted extracellular nuclease
MTNKRRLERGIAGLLVVVMLLTMVPLAGVPPVLAQGTTVFVNELHYDNDGIDTGEFIEIAGPAGTDLSGWSLVLYNGNGGAVYNTKDLTGVVIPDQDNGFGTVAFGYPQDGIQNGSPDGLALVGPGGVVIQFLSYEGSFVAVGGPADGMTSTDIGVVESSSTLVGYSLQLAGTGSVYEDFSWNTPLANTRGAVNAGQTFAEVPDADGDGIPDDVDNCPGTYNPGQEDGDGDGIGDVCDGCPVDPDNDIDGDGICGDVDNCPNTPNSGQEDADGDGLGDACDGCPNDLENDIDADGICGDVDNCPYVYNPGQEDSDGDGIGDACDAPDADGDGIPDDVDNCPGTYNPGQEDGDGDGVGDACDSCPNDPENDADADGVCGDVDNCPNASNPGQEDGDGDGIGDACDSCPADPDNDIDGDGVCGDVDNCPYVYNPDQADGDGDGIGDACDVPEVSIIINEVDSDTPSYDALEFIELYDGGVGNMALDGLVVVLFNGSDDAAYDPAFDLDGFTTDADGYFVIGSVAGADIYVDPGDYGWLQNGADAVALYSGDGADFPNDTPVTTDGLLDALVYDTSDSDDAGLLILLNAGQPQVNEGGLGDKDNHSNQRCPNGEGGARNTDTYTQFAATPGWANCEPPPEACGDPFTPIYTIQGDGLASDLDGELVSTEGIVVGDFQDGKSGYYIQDALGDGDTATSDGIFVYGTSPDVNVGDHVRVRGYVDEYYDLTEVTSVSQVWSCSTGNSVAATPLSLPVTSVDDFEAYEGMLVTFPQALYISEYYNFGRYGEIVLTTERQFQPTAVYEPGSPEAAALAEANGLSRITLDDGRSSQNPDPAIHPNGNVFDLTNLFRGGDTVQNMTGVVDYNFGLYKVQPTQGADYVSANPRTGPDGVGDSNVKVASFNVLNYFTTIDTGDWICGPSGDMECRGADTVEEFERQRAKIISAIEAIDADVVGLIEIENNEFEAVADLVGGLNDAMGATAYAYVDTGYIGTDAIKVAFVYKPATVSLVGDYAILDSSVDSRFIDTRNRPVLAQTFMDNADGGIFTVAVNHLKSKGSSCADIGDPDLGDGAGNCNLTRTAAAEAMVDWLAADPTSSGDSDVLIIGDLNSYDKEDPIDVLVAGGYTDLNFSLLGEYAYSYVFDGQLGYLDYALASAGLLGEVTGATVWHINADEPSLIDYDMSYKLPAQDALYAPDAYRASDHDPVIAGLSVCDEIAPTAEIRLNHEYLWPPNHKYVTVHAKVKAEDNFDPNPTVTLVSVTSNEPDNGLGDGDLADDIVIMNDFTFKLRAERSGGGQDRIYTITYKVTDACGNDTFATATVTVLHDRGQIR